MRLSAVFYIWTGERLNFRKYWIIDDPGLRFMMHKVLPCFYWVFIPWLLVFGAPLYVITEIIQKVSWDEDWKFSNDDDPLVSVFLVAIGLIFASYFGFIAGLLMIPFWLAFVPY